MNKTELLKQFNEELEKQVKFESINCWRKAISIAEQLCDCKCEKVEIIEEVEKPKSKKVACPQCEVK